MWTLMIVMIVSVYGALGTEICLLNKFVFCRHLYPEVVDEMIFPPNVQEMRKICPEVLKYYQCLQDHDQVCISNDATSETIFSTANIISEICDEESLLHNAYKNSSSCFGDIARSSVPSDCELKSEIAVNAYLIYRSDEDDVDDADRTHYRYCLEKSYKMACMARKIDEVCEEVALLTFLDVLHRSKYLSPICSKSTVEELNDEFLELLDLEEEELGIFSRVFNFRTK